MASRLTQNMRVSDSVQAVRSIAAAPRPHLRVVLRLLVAIRLLRCAPRSISKRHAPREHIDIWRGWHGRLLAESSVRQQHSNPHKLQQLNPAVTNSRQQQSLLH